MGWMQGGLVLRRRAPAAELQSVAPRPAIVQVFAKNGDVNLSNILKLVPGDVVAIYLAGRGITVPPAIEKAWPMVLCWLCLILCVLLRYLTAKRTDGKINWALIVVTTVAFFIWAHAVASEKGPLIDVFYGSLAGFAAMVFGLVAPLLVPAETEPVPPKPLTDPVKERAALAVRTQPQ